MTTCAAISWPDTVVIIAAMLAIGGLGCVLAWIAK